MIVGIRISGAGGQGVLLAGLILAEAAGMYEDKNVLQVQDYGGQVRGGAVRSDVLIATGEEIVNPALSAADILLALSPGAIQRWLTQIKDGGCLIYDSSTITGVPPMKATAFSAQLTLMAKREVGTELSANFIALGATCALTGIVSKEALEWAAPRRAPKGLGDVNLRALRIGFQLGEGWKVQGRAANPS